MLDFESLIIYSSALFISCFFAYFYDRYGNKWGLWGAFFCMAFFCATRYDVGFDYRGYVNIFNNIRDGYESYVEPGYYSLNYLFSHFDNGYLYVLGIMSVLTIGLLFHLYSRSHNLVWNIFFLFTFQFLFQFNNQVRQGLAIVIFWWALQYLEKPKIGKYVACILVGTLFHYTIAFFLLLIPLRKLQLSPYVWMTLIAGSFLISLTGIFEKIGNVILSHLPFYVKYLTYGNRIEAEAHTHVLIIFFWVCVSIIIALGHKHVRDKRMLNFYLLAMALYPIFVPYHLIERMLLYLMFLNGLLAADISRKSYTLGGILFIIGLFIFTIYCLNNWGLSGGFPYYSVFGDHVILE